MKPGSHVVQTSVIPVDQQPEPNVKSYQEETIREKRASRLVLAVLVFLGLLYSARIGPPVTYPAWGLDNSMYLVSAKALAEGHGYRLISHPDAPVEKMFPIGYPAILSVAVRLFSIDAVGLTVMRGISLLACLIFLLLGYRLLRRYIPPVRAAVAVLLIGLVPWVMFWMAQIYSFLGLKVGVVIPDISYVYDAKYENKDHFDARFHHLKPSTRQEA